MIFEAIVLLAVIFSKFSSSYDCNEKYLAFSKQHSMCQKPNMLCKVIGKGLTKEDKDLIVEVHNLLRCKLATGKEKGSVVMPEAANMLEMEWDDELAGIAQKHAELCSFKHDCKECRRVERFTVGQNMALRTNVTLQKNFKKTILDLYGEIKDFDKRLISAYSPPTKIKEYGHFTQIIWSESWKIGCGYVEYKLGERISGLLICNYGPTGNVHGKQIYKEGDPCSSCPPNSCCREKCELFNVTAKYCGLCKMVG